VNSEEIRTSPALLRNAYPCSEGIDMPVIQPQATPHIDSMLSVHDVRPTDLQASKTDVLVHFFKDDPRFEYLYEKPYSDRAFSKLKQLAQYTAVCTPDFSLYPEMPYPVQLFQVFKNRWCGAHWQAVGLCVLPTVTWGDASSYAFCFDGLPTQAAVVVSTVGCTKSKQQFLAGYDKMLEVLQPQTILCYGTPFPEMQGNLISYPYAAFKKEATT